MAGCLGSIGDAGGGGADKGATSGADGGGGSSSGSEAGSGGVTWGAGVGTTNPRAVPVAHLTSLQYANTVSDLFAPVAVPAQTLPSDVVVGGFDNNASAQSPSAALIDAYHTAAVSLATAAMGAPSALLGCTPATRTDEDQCAQTFLGTFATKAFRRPLTGSELPNLVALYTSRRTAGDDFPMAMTLCIEAVLQSSAFLYRVEIGTPVAGKPNLVQLTPYEMASRLSYFLWNTMPDGTLMASAASGALASASGVQTQARRMLADPRAHDAIVHFHAGWLRFDTMNDLSKDPTAFPSFDATVNAAMIQSAQKFVDGVFFFGGTLPMLLTDAHAWVNDSLAPLYGVASPGSAQLTLVSVDPNQRSGILTNAGLMAGMAHASQDSPVLRGVFVLDRLMCDPPPDPPAGVNMTVPAPAPTKPETTRQIFATTHEQGTCAGCHHKIDGIGFGFEHYDAIGHYRTTDDGLPVDSSGWFPDGETDLSGTFSDAVALGKKLSTSGAVQACVVSQWLRYGLGVNSTGIDVTKIKPLTDAFSASGLKMSELVVALVQSDVFRTRLVGN